MQLLVSTNTQHTPKVHCNPAFVPGTLVDALKFQPMPGLSVDQHTVYGHRLDFSLPPQAIDIGASLPISSIEAFAHEAFDAAYGHDQRAWVITARSTGVPRVDKKSAAGQYKPFGL